MSGFTREDILARFAEVEREHGIRVLLAVESGSRAWGFPSSDSDWDVRFVHAHPPARYLSTAPLADTIEPVAVAGGLDLGGWDLRKALWLLCRSNATPLEWATSPIRYREEGGLAARLVDLAERVVSRDALAWHYRQMARRAWAAVGEMPGPVPLKPLCYALRAALATLWLEPRRGLDRAPGLPPMSLAALLAGDRVGEEVRAAARALVARKAKGDERATGPCDPALAALIRAQLAPTPPRPAPVRPSTDAIAAADALFRDALGCAGGYPGAVGAPRPW